MNTAKEQISRWVRPKVLMKEENVPPMNFHTLVENGITHGYEK